MNIWIFLFFFAIAAGLVVLFVVGTSCGVSQQITNEDACDPYAPKEKKNSLFELQEGLVFKKRHDFLEQPHVATRMFNGERQKFCVHGIIGARQTGASNEHEHQTQFS